MRKSIVFLSLLLTSYTMTAQIDRSKMPVANGTPTIDLGTPTTYQMPNGITLMVVENHKLPQITLSLSLDIPPINEHKVGVSQLTSSLLGKGTATISKDAFNEEVEFMGANISVHMQGGYASSLTRYFPRVLELFAEATLNPLFSAEELEKERTKAIQELKSGENSAQAVSARVNMALVYSQNHPYGKFETEASLNSITIDDVKKFYQENFSPANAYIIIVGDIKAEEAKTLVEKNFHRWLPSKALKTSLYQPKDVQYTQINFVDMPNAVQSELNVFNTIKLKMSDKDYFPTLVMNYILGGGFSSYINMNLREKNGFTYGARSWVGNNKWTEATFGVSTKVRNEVTAAAIQEILNEIKRIQTEEVSAEILAEAKANYLGSFVLSTESASTIARFAMQIQTQKLPKDFYTNYIKNIEAVTAADVKRVANKYIKTNNLRFVVVSKASETAPSLEALKFNSKAMPVFYFDKEANKISKP